jgi:putative DNA primase/helicase
LFIKTRANRHDLLSISHLQKNSVVYLPYKNIPTMTEKITDVQAGLPSQLGITPVPNLTNCQSEPTQHPKLVETIREEFKASAIAEDIAALNFRTWNPLNENDLDEVFTLLVAEPEHRNNGTLAGRSQNDLANTLRGGGWIFEGHRGVCVKPDSPRKNADGKVIKYESPRGAGNQQLFVPHVSIRIADEIMGKLGFVREHAELLPPTDIDREFWGWYLSTNLPLINTEGAKKAASFVSAGYPAIAFNGVWGWGTNEKDMFGEIERGEHGESLKILNPDLLPFLDDREIVLAFDRDDSPLTVKKVEAAKKRFCQEVEGIVAGVTQIKWTGYKGADDFIAAKGVKALDKAYAKRLELLLPGTKDVHFTSSVEDGLQKINNISNEYIGNHLTAIATIDNPDEDGSALLLEFTTFKGSIRRWSMLRADLAGDAKSIIEGLLSRGYSFKREQKGLLLDYLYDLGKHILQTYTITDSSGWIGKSFVLPHKTYGDESLKFRNVDPSPEAITELKGTLQGWKDTVAARCGGNSRLILGLGTSFAAPLLPIINIESGGFHLIGDTSQGKTIILSVAASVTGVKDIPQWRTTTNGLESTATAFNHLCLPLDEIGQADPKDVGNIAYMLANGQGKARMKKDLTNRKPKKWQLMVLSSGEFGLGKYMAQANITLKGGQEVRLPDVPAVPEGSIYGCFETIHDADTSAQFILAIEAAVKEHHGTALDAFLSRLVIDAADPAFVGNLSKQVHLVAAKLAKGTVDSAVGRVAKRFALVQVVLGLAHKYDLLPFPVEDIGWGISTCFKAWLTARGGDGSIEIKMAIERIEHLLVTNEFSDRVYDLREGDTKTIRNLLAYRKVGVEGDTEEFWVPPTVFDKEFVVGVNKGGLVKKLHEAGWLDLSEEGKTRQRTVNKKIGRYYVFIKWKNKGDEGDEGDEGILNSLP